jgi:hypothetical protein
VALAGDLQRERAVASLRRHYLQGRLELDELADRTERALKARTTGDLRATLRDLPRLGEVAERARGAIDLAARLLALAAVWLFGSVFCLASFGVALLAGEGGLTLLAFPLVWLALTAAVWLSARRRLRRTGAAGRRLRRA